MRFVATEADKGKRLDVFIVERIPKLSRAFVSKLIDQKKVRFNSEVSKAGAKLKAGDTVEVDFDLEELKRIPSIQLPIIYEDDNCVVINKPVGVLTHSKGSFSPEATVATWLRSRVNGLEGERAGIVHRLDRATSGVMICAKNPTALSWLQKQFSQRKVKKTYVAIISGEIEPVEAVIDMPVARNPKAPATFYVAVAGKSALTHYKTVKVKNKKSELLLTPETGRTHQLRVHLAHQHHPIIGDTIYGGEPAERLMLHAKNLEITLPNRERKTFTAPVPAVFNKKLRES